jgi:hypothetical protein
MAQRIEKFYKFIAKIAGIWGLISSFLSAMQALPFHSAQGNELTKILAVILVLLFP